MHIVDGVGGHASGGDLVHLCVVAMRGSNNLKLGECRWTVTCGGGMEMFITLCALCRWMGC